MATVLCSMTKEETSATVSPIKKVAPVTVIKLKLKANLNHSPKASF